MSHLSTLIERVERDRIQQNKLFFNERLMNLAEYIVYYNDYSAEEEKRAKELLREFDFDVELSLEGLERKHVELHGLVDMYSPICLRCGKTLSNPLSVKKGLGPVCRSKVMRGDWGKEEREARKAWEHKAQTSLEVY